MREQKLNKLFEAARNEVPPAASGDFEARVLRGIRLDGATTPATSLFDQLNFLFPRIALATVAIMIACTVFEVVSDGPDFTDSAAQASDQWLFGANEL